MATSICCPASKSDEFPSCKGTSLLCGMSLTECIARLVGGSYPVKLPWCEKPSDKVTVISFFPATRLPTVMLSGLH